MENVTREEINDYLDDKVNKKELSKVTKNKIIKILDHCNSVMVFQNLTDGQILSTARTVGVGGERDLGKETYDAIHETIAFVKELRMKKDLHAKEEEKLRKEQEEKELLENPEFSLPQLKGIVNLMELSGAVTINLRKIKQVMECFKF